MKTTRYLSFASACALALMFFPMTGKAQLLEYNSLTSFDAATTGLTTETFEELTIPANSYVTHTGTQTFGSLSLSQTGFEDYAVNGTGLGNGDGTQYFDADGRVTSFTLNLSSGTASALGTDIFSNVSGVSVSGVATASDGSTLSFTALPVPAATGSLSTVGFLGFTDLSPGVTITSIKFTPVGGIGFAVDNVDYGTAILAAPEPTTYAMLVGGIALLLFRLRSRQRKVGSY